ncbi:MAG: hypothetical protein M1823_000708 [Watsoniomyces obsoletus]|nr:MAG: hypothetical protein M1823_000708 [Watsoniomyces obsoletus]
MRDSQPRGDLARASMVKFPIGLAVRASCLSPVDAPFDRGGGQQHELERACATAPGEARSCTVRTVERAVESDSLRPPAVLSVGEGGALTSTGSGKGEN